MLGEFCCGVCHAIFPLAIKSKAMHIDTQYIYIYYAHVQNLGPPHTSCAHARDVCVCDRLLASIIVCVLCCVLLLLLPPPPPPPPLHEEEEDYEEE
jgi:hypothetical protein